MKIFNKNELKINKFFRFYKAICIEAKLHILFGFPTNDFLIKNIKNNGYYLYLA